MTNILEELLYPVSVQKFFQFFWEKEVLHIDSNKIKFFSKILSKNDLNIYLSRNDIRYPNLRMVKNGYEIPIDEYTYEYLFAGDLFEGNVDIDKVFHLYSNGSTINLQLVEKVIQSAAFFKNNFEKQYNFPIQLHTFITPPFSMGFTEHYDTNSFFILQLEGQKIWDIYDAPYKMPLLEHRENIGDKYIETIKFSKRITLKEGELLYIPCGTYHKAVTKDKGSIHVTIGLLPQTWSDVMHKAIDEITFEHIALRKSLVNNSFIDNNEFKKTFNEILKILNNYMYAHDNMNYIKTEIISKQLYDSENRFSDLLLSNTLTEETTLKIRNIHYFTEESFETISIIFYNKSITIPIIFKEELNYIFSINNFKPLDINTNIDIESKIKLCKTLLLEGLLTIER